MSEARMVAIVADRPWQRFRDSFPPGLVTAMLAGVAAVIPALLLRYSMMTVAGAVVGMIGLAWITSRPFVGLLLFLGLLYLRPEELFPALAGARMTLLVSLIALFAWVINGLLCREQFLTHLPVVRSFLGFCAVALGSTLLSGSDTFGDQALDMLKLFILFILVLHLVTTERRLQAVTAAIVLFSAFLGGRTIWDYQHGQALVQSDGDVRALATGIFGDPNDLALAMAMALPLALGAALSKRHWFVRLWSGAVAPILVWTIFVTNSRGGMLALGIAVFLFFRRRLGRAGLILGTVAVLGLFAFGPSRLSQMSAQEESAAGRVSAWEAGMDMVRQSPLWGVGKGQFCEYNFLTAHNSLVLCLAELGLAGTAFWIGLFYFALRDGQFARAASDCGLQIADCGSKDRHSSPNPQSQGLAPAIQNCCSMLLQVSLVTFMVGGFFLSRTYTPPLYVYLGLAVAAAQVEAGQAGRTLPAASARDLANVAALTLASLMLVALLVRLWS